MNAKLGITDGVMMCEHDECSAFWILSSDEDTHTLSELVTIAARHESEKHGERK